MNLTELGQNDFPLIPLKGAKSFMLEVPCCLLGGDNNCFGLVYLEWKLFLFHEKRSWEVGNFLGYPMPDGGGVKSCLWYPKNMAAEKIDDLPFFWDLLLENIFPTPFIA